MNDASTAALDALKRGWAPLPIPRGEKRPTLREWQAFRADPERVEETFHGNLGLILGDPSGGLVDVDCDTPEAARLATAWLPPTELRHGRPGNPGSHRWYVAAGTSGVRRFQAPDGATLVELRGNGGQTVVPPSLHPSGEPYAWEAHGEPGRVPFDELLGRVARVAAGALLARAWPANGSRHDAALALGGFLLRRGLADAPDFVAGVAAAAGDEEAEDRRRAVRDTAGTLRAGGRATGGPTVERIFGKPVLDRVGEWLGLGRAVAVGARRPVIQVKAGELPRVVDEAVAALEGSGLYQRGGTLVRAVRGAPVTVEGVARDPSALSIVTVTGANLAETLTRLAAFQKWDGRAEAFVPTDCPDKVAATLLARAEWPLPPLTGVVTAPTLRPDGSILQAEGYDRETGLLVDFGGVAFPPIPEEPTRLDAMRALEMLSEVLSDFPYVDETDRSAALASLLTPLVRRSLPSAPLILFAAPKPRSGKTLQATIGAVLATGHRPATVTYSDDPQEERKKMMSVLLAGDVCLTIDNVSTELGGDALCTVLTEPVFTDRLLGSNRTATVPTNVFITATGNNVAVSGDLSFRVLPVMIDPGVERPEERVFDVDLLEEVPRRRGELVAAGLIVMRAYHVAGRPPQGRPRWGGFDEWARWVRDPLVWLGCADPCDGRRRVEANDPVRQGLAALLAAWEGAFGRAPGTVAEVARLLAEGRGVWPAPEPEATAALREAVLEVAGTVHGEIKTRQLGVFIRAHARRIEGGRRFVEVGTAHGGGTKWRVEVV